MKNLLAIFLFILIIAIWLFPVIIAFVTWNFWLILLYVVWWVPAIVLAKIISAVIEWLM